MVRRVVAFIALASIAAAAACGSRGPLDDSPWDTDGGGSGSGDLDAGGAGDTAPVVDAAPDAPVDAGHDATIIDCVQCISGNCSTQLFQCIQSQPCQQAFACVAQKCLAGGGGGFDPSCLLGCASGNAQGALQVLEVFMCVQGTCGMDCTSLLGGLGGLGGGGGGGGGRRDGG